MKDGIKSMQMSQKKKFGKILDMLNDITTARIRNHIEVTFSKFK